MAFNDIRMMNWTNLTAILYKNGFYLHMIFDKAAGHARKIWTNFLIPRRSYNSVRLTSFGNQDCADAAHVRYRSIKNGAIANAFASAFTPGDTRRPGSNRPSKLIVMLDM